MDIGVPREIKAQEGRVALLPAQVESLVATGRRVRVERGAGGLSGAEDRDYEVAGAELLNDAAEVYAGSELIVKVKEILPGIDQIIIYLIAVIILLVRPRGLLGRKGVMET